MDGAFVAEGFPVLPALPDAYLFEPTMAQLGRRNDRPGGANHLVFVFELAEAPAAGQRAEVQLRGPVGFTFASFCLPVETTVERPLELKGVQPLAKAPVSLDRFKIRITYVEDLPPKAFIFFSGGLIILRFSTKFRLGGISFREIFINMARDSIC